MRAANCRRFYRVKIGKFYLYLMDASSLRQYLQQISPLSAETLSLLVDRAQYIVLKKGDRLLKEGEICKAHYLVDAGYLRTWYNKDGTEINIHFSLEGDFITNLKSLKTQTPSEYHIEAGEPAGVWVFERGTLSGLGLAHPEILNFARSLLNGILLRLEEHSTALKIYSPAERYQYIEEKHPRLLQRIPLSQLASYLGVTRETLSRVRNKRIL